MCLKQKDRHKKYTKLYKKQTKYLKKDGYEMKYTGMPAAMWLLFAKSFRQQLVENYHMNGEVAKEVTVKAEIKV